MLDKRIAIIMTTYKVKLIGKSYKKKISSFLWFLYFDTSQTIL